MIIFGTILALKMFKANIRKITKKKKMETIVFEITNKTLQYASFTGGLTLWVIITFFIFRYNLGKLF
jgi:hypothetical protein